MSFIDFDKNNYEAKRILLNDILIENKDSIILERYYSTYVYSTAIKYKFMLKINKYRIEGYLEYKNDEVQYLLIKIYHKSWLGLLSSYLGSCVYSWEFQFVTLPEDIEQSKTYLRSILNNKVAEAIREEEKKAAENRKKELAKEYKLTATFVNYFKKRCRNKI